MTTALPDHTLRRIAAALTLAASSSGAPDGERLAAIAAAERLLAANGLTLADLAAASRPARPPAPEPPAWSASDGDLPPWREMVRDLCDYAERLTEWEQGFIASLSRRRYSPTERQHAVVARLYRRHVLDQWD
jgi:hypothetical protein